MTGGPVVGVDVGGSGLRLQVSYAGVPGPVRTGRGVRIGPTGIDVAATVTDARALLRAELAAAPDSASGAEPAVVVWSMRGLLFLADRCAVLSQVREALGGATTVVVSDAVANLVGAVGEVRPGAVVAAGSGAVAFGSDFEVVWRRVDGWGHLLGDVGSGAWIGLEGLRAALRADDGLVGGSALLLAAGVERFGPTATWPRQLMTARDAPERLASFAPVVTAAAADPDGADPGETVAAHICRRAGRGLAEALLAASAGLDDPALIATGGVLAAAPVRTALVARLGEAGRAHPRAGRCPRRSRAPGSSSARSGHPAGAPGIPARVALLNAPRRTAPSASRRAITPAGWSGT